LNQDNRNEEARTMTMLQTRGDVQMPTVEAETAVEETAVENAPTEQPVDGAQQPGQPS